MSYDDFIQAVAADGLQIDQVVPDKLTRCKVDGDRGGKASGWYRLFSDGIPTGVWGNWKTGASGIWTARERMTPMEQAAHRARIEQARREREAEQRQQWAVNLRRNQALWADAKSIMDGDPVALYLASRGLPIPDSPALRCAPALPYHGGAQCLGNYPAMLGAVTGPGGELVSVHRTYLTPDGSKADVPTVKKLMPASGPMGGASIKIGKPMQRADGVALAVAEGIETALAVTALHGIPCWAAVSAAGMEKFIVPDGVTLLFVMADHDRNSVGQKAAQALAIRAAVQGITARVCIPPDPGTDWADVLAASL